MEKNLTTGSVFKNLISFSLPFLLSYFLQTLYGLADLYIIGQFCPTEATTAVSVGSQVMHMLTVMIVGLAMGSTVLIGKYVGAGQSEQRNIAIGNTATIFTVLSVVLAVVLIFLRSGIVNLISTPSEAVEGTKAYLLVCFLGVPFIVAYNIISSIFRGMGDSKSPMCFVAIACAFNIGLDYLFIGALEYGPLGAALGTTIAQILSVIIALAVISRKKMITGISVEDFRVRKEIAGSIFKVGIPVSMQDGFIQISFMLITVFANMRGLSDSAAVGIVEKVIGIMFLIPSTLLASVSALAAQNIGAKKHDRADKTLLYSAIIATSFGLFFSILFQFLAEETVGLFSEDSEVIRLGASYLRSYVWDCMFAGVHFSFSGYFCAYGKSGISFMHNIISILTARIPIAYYASVHYPDTLFPMGLGATIGSLISVIICSIAFIVLRKKRNNLQNKESML